ncbi:MAG: hypothetical protein LBD12_01495 [Clostridiales Family XIII bacterium]|jgi:hypothetical protein|nr:hypothetical protein [Clostridiales Family XIII bacterium]
MTARETLLAHRALRLTIARKALDVEYAMTRAQDAGSATLGGMPRQAPVRDRMGDAVAESVDLAREWATLLRDAEDEWGRISSMVPDGMPPALQTLLTMRYRFALGWGEVARAMGCSVRHAIRLHGDALGFFSQPP